MAPVADFAEPEGRGSGVENEAVQLGRGAALGLELGRGRSCSQAKGTGRIRPAIGNTNPAGKTLKIGHHFRN